MHDKLNPDRRMDTVGEGTITNALDFGDVQLMFPNDTYPKDPFFRRIVKTLHERRWRITDLRSRAAANSAHADLLTAEPESPREGEREDPIDRRVRYRGSQNDFPNHDRNFRRDRYYYDGMRSDYCIGSDCFGDELWVNRADLTAEERQGIIDGLRREAAEDIALADELERTRIDIRTRGAASDPMEKIVQLTASQQKLVLDETYELEEYPDFNRSSE